jgi:hypothetical protein
MVYYLTKLFLSAAIIVVVSEVAKVNATLGALIKSLPMISLLALVWIWQDTGNRAAISDLSVSTFWLVIPTLPMFLVLPALLERGWGFYPALASSVGVMLVCYLVAIPILGRFGFSI